MMVKNRTSVAHLVRIELTRRRVLSVWREAMRRRSEVQIREIRFPFLHSLSVHSSRPPSSSPILSPGENVLHLLGSFLVRLRVAQKFDSNFPIIGAFSDDGITDSTRGTAYRKPLQLLLLLLLKIVSGLDEWSACNRTRRVKSEWLSIHSNASLHPGNGS